MLLPKVKPVAARVLGHHFTYIGIPSPRYLLQIHNHLSTANLQLFPTIFHPLPSSTETLVTSFTFFFFFIFVFSSPVHSISHRWMLAHSQLGFNYIGALAMERTAKCECDGVLHSQS